MAHSVLRYFSDPYVLAYAAVLVGAALLRFVGLGDRPIQVDESLQTMHAYRLFDGLHFNKGAYPNVHGPTNHYGMALLFWLLGDTLAVTRTFQAVVGSGLVLLPHLFRGQLGSGGTLTAALLLAVSPTLTFYSRFVNHDIILAALTMGLLVAVWRYLESGRGRYLYVMAVLLGLAFTTKLTAYGVAALLSLYLVLSLVPNYRLLRPLVCRALPWTLESRRLGLLVWVVTVVATVSAAWVAWLQPLFPADVIVALPVHPDVSHHAAWLSIGVPSGTAGLVVASVSLLAVWGGAVAVGLWWHRGLWWRTALVFHLVWAALLTFGFTHLMGLAIGLWQNLGFWLARQGSGLVFASPWVYVRTMTLFEYMPLALGSAGVVYSVMRRDRFGLFLSFWAVASAVLYQVASERVPWHTIHIAMPLCLLAGWFVGSLDTRGRFVRAVTACVLIGLAVLTVRTNLLTNHSATPPNHSAAPFLEYERHPAPALELMALLGQRESPGPLLVHVHGGLSPFWLWRELDFLIELDPAIADVAFFPPPSHVEGYDGPIHVAFQNVYSWSEPTNWLTYWWHLGPLEPSSVRYRDIWVAPDRPDLYRALRPFGEP